MDNQHYIRGRVLLEQSRPREAVDEFRQALANDPNDAAVHAMLGAALVDLEQYQEATEHAQRAVGLDPENPITHFILALVSVNRNRLTPARESIEAALRLDQQNPSFFHLRGMINVQQKKWKQALADADAGLRIDPEDTDCLNLRAMAKTQLGDTLAADESLGAAMSQNPDDPATHANQGWTLLQRGQPKEAMGHFREALRLEPEMEWARRGIIEAMKARNPLYRWFLKYMFFMQSLQGRFQWGIIIGLWIGAQMVARVADNSPEWAPYAWCVLGVYIFFVWTTWIAVPLFNLMLFTSRFGRLALSDDEKKGAMLLGLTMLAAIAAAVHWWFADSVWSLHLALRLAGLTIPVSSVFTMEAGSRRAIMAALTGFIALVGIATLFRPFAMVRGDDLMVNGIGSLVATGYWWMILGVSVLANTFHSAPVRK